MANRDYSGKVVVVTGGAGGLGQALCRRFAAAGAKVAAVDRNEEAVRAFAAALEAEGFTAIGLACDVTDFASCTAAVEEVVGRFGGVDVLINNAGISHRSYFRETDPAVIRRVMDVNFFGAVHGTKAALPSLLERKGQIVAISSIAGFSPLLERTGYSASKHALHGFFDSLRAEVEDDGVDVMLVCPGFVATGIEASALGGDGGAVKVPRKTVGEEMTPTAMADLIFQSAASRATLCLPTALPRLSWWVSRIFPRFFARMMRRRVAT